MIGAGVHSKASVEGESLAERLARGVLPAEDALRLAVDLGTALNALHARGAAHGMLSPWSVALSVNGVRLLKTPVAGPETAPYRSPEQVRGGAPDERSDIFAFGALLYEMVSGKRAFAGEGRDLDEAILHGAPAPLAGRTAMVAAMEGVVAGCLQKDPAARRQRIQNAVTELKLAAGMSAMGGNKGKARPRAGLKPAGNMQPELTAPVDHLPRSADPRRNRRALAWAGLALVGLAAAAGGGTMLLRRSPAAPVARFALPLPADTAYPGVAAVSPDGRYVAFSAAGPRGVRRLWLRPLDAETAEPVPGTDGASAPFWSPDSRSIAYFSGDGLYRTQIPSGPVRRICAAEPAPGGGSWGAGDVILYASGMSGGLFRVPARGGAPVRVSTPAEGQRAHLWPHFLPDGKHFLFFASGDPDRVSGVYAGSLDDSEYRPVVESESNAVYAAGDGSGDGRLLFVRGGSLYAQRFRTRSAEVSGPPVEVAPRVGVVASLSLMPASASWNGVLVYQKMGTPTRQLVWVNRAGLPLSNVEEPGEWGAPSISPDGKRAVAARAERGETKADLWLIDESGAASLLAKTAADEGSPVWSPDGSRIAFFSKNGGAHDLYTANVNTPRQDPLLISASSKYPTAWSRDGRYLVFGAVTESTRAGVWALSMPGRLAAPLVDTVYSEGFGVVSPDGKWLAYQSDESGANEIYVQPFDPSSPDTKRRWQASANGGTLPRWRADGSELFYLDAGSAIMSVPVRTDGESFEPGPARILFRTRHAQGRWNFYDAAPDGQRFLVNLPFEWSDSATFQVTTNWMDRLPK